MFIYLKHFNQKNINFDKPEQYVVYFYNVSGEIRFDINACNVHLYVFGLYKGSKDESFSLETRQFHHVANSYSQVLVKSVMSEESSFIYDGLIRIEKQAVKTHAYQKNMNMLLSKKASVVSRPFLEILTNDVFCTHASSTGQLDGNLLHYLQSRGLGVENAKQLLIDGFINDIFQQMKNLEPDYKIKIDL